MNSERISMFRNGFLVWLLIIAVEVLHGIFRQVVLVPVLSDFRARQFSVFTGSILIFLIALAAIRRIKPKNYPESLLVGLFWVILTVGFEVGLGVFVFGYGSARIFEDYDISNGGLMGIGLLLMLFSPLVAARLRLDVGAGRQRV